MPHVEHAAFCLVTGELEDLYGDVWQQRAGQLQAAFDVGEATYFEVNEAQAEVLAAEAELITAITNWRQSQTELLAAQGYRMAFAGMTLPNDPSVAFHTALGFEPIAH